MRQTGRSYSGDGNGFFQVHGWERVLFYWFAACRGEFGRVESSDAFASRSLWDDRFVLLFSNAAANAAGFGTNDPISVTDLHRDDSNLCSQGIGKVNAVVILRHRIYRNFTNRTR